MTHSALYRGLAARAASGRPVRVGLIGAGKFGTMFLAQAVRGPGLHVVAVADRERARAEAACRAAGWPEARFAAPDLEQALAGGGTSLTEDALGLAGSEAVDVVVEATGVPAAAIRHAETAIAAGRHVVMVSVEADALAGPLLGARAARAGVVYSLAYGDQPALVCEMVDWARATGFEVIAAGKGTKYLPAYHHSTPETVWQHYGLSAEAAAAGGMNARMFNSFLDGTKSAIEMAAIANACGLDAAPEGLAFPPCGAHELAARLRPQAEGGVLEKAGTVEVVSSLARDGSPVADDLRWGVYVVIRAPDAYARRCFVEYGLAGDESGYAALWRPYHLIGLELGISVASAALLGAPTGSPSELRADVVAVAKRDLAVGEMLDGEGGYTVWGRLAPAAAARAAGALPIGLAHGVRLVAPVAEGEVVRWSDLVVDESDPAVAARRAMEAAFTPA